MTDLVEFLQARLDEDERRIYQHDDPLLSSDDEERALISVAHRRVALLAHRKCGATCFELRMRALRYEDHPDYREEWRHQNS